MSIKLYTDKTELFECNVSLDGASIKDSKLRAILKFDDKNLMVEGKINSNGKGQIILPKLKNISQDGEVGQMQLEVIAEDAYFQPYEENFEVKVSKKAIVEVISKKEKKPKIVIEKVLSDFPASLKITNIELDPDLFEIYKERIPVVRLNGEDCFVYKVHEITLRKKLEKLI